MKKKHSEEEIEDTFKQLGIDTEDRRKEIIGVQNINELTEKKPQQIFFRIDTTSKIYGRKEDARLESDT